MRYDYDKSNTPDRRHWARLRRQAPDYKKITKKKEEEKYKRLATFICLDSVSVQILSPFSSSLCAINYLCNLYLQSCKSIELVSYTHLDVYKRQILL